MPSLTLRKIGVSYLIEGVACLGLDAEDLWHQFERSFGAAAGAMRAFPEPRQEELTAILVDHKADSWDGLRYRLEDWLNAQGARNTSWDQLEDGAARLRFDL